jgi:K+-transporting ATPase ATPase C chain
MSSLLRPAASLLLFFTVLTGAAYPALVTAVSQVVFPSQANGSLLPAKTGGGFAGSKLIGQAFADPGHFWSRPSATAPYAYNAGASTGSNLGPTNPALADAVKGRVEALRQADPGNTAPVPVDLVTTSGSGLDPEISPAAAYYQVGRVARVRGVPQAQVRALLDSHVEGRTFGILGEPRVNVLQLNLDLDQLAQLGAKGGGGDVAAH